MTSLLYVGLGSALGYAWYRWVGCASGVCLITARWWSATLYGAIMGWMMSRVP